MNKEPRIRKRLPIAWKPFNVMVPGAGTVFKY